MNTNLQMVQMGKISSILNDEKDINENPVWAQVIPCTADTMVTPKIRIPYYLRGQWGNLEVDTLVLFFLAEDGTGIILMRMDGEWDGHMHGDITILKGFLEMTEGDFKMDKGNAVMTEGDMTMAKGSLTLSEGDVKANGKIDASGDVSSEGKISATGDVSSEGNIQATGSMKGASIESQGELKGASADISGALSAASVSSSGDVTAGGTSLKSHTHPTTSEGSPTGPPS